MTMQPYGQPPGWCPDPQVPGQLRWWNGQRWLSDVAPMPPGWYPDPRAPGVQRYWDGQQWTDNIAATGPQVIQVNAQPAPYQLQPAMHVSGLTTGGHVMHAILTVCTCGLWGIVWAARSFFGRRRIG